MRLFVAKVLHLFLWLYASALFLSAEELQDILDVHPPIAIPFYHSPWAWGFGVVGLLLLIGLIFLLIRFFKKYRSKCLRTTYDYAQEELAQAHKLMLPGKDKLYSAAVSNAVRYYIEREYAIPAPEQTTEEFLQAIQADPPFITAHINLLTHFLALCDQAKFARQAFAAEQRLQLLENAKNFIKETYRARHPQKKEPPKVAS